jgi:hypothetical protein
MPRVEVSAAVVIRLRPVFPAVVHRAKRDNAPVTTRIGQVMQFDRPSPANQTAKRGNAGHIFPRACGLLSGLTGLPLVGYRLDAFPRWAGLFRGFLA